MEHKSKTSPKIFVIGPNKCGTTSLHRLFLGSKINALHNVYYEAKHRRNAALRVFDNISLGRKPVAGMDEFIAFSDLNIDGRFVSIDMGMFFRIFHAAYPDAYFILNTRPVEKWIRSRCNAVDGKLVQDAMHATGSTEEEVISGWEKSFFAHGESVRSYFKDNPRFIEFDIESDDIQLIKTLLSDHYDIDNQEWGQRNKSPE